MTQFNDNESPANWLAIVRRHVETLNYGVVQIVVHDSRVVQIERTEKVRLDAPHSAKQLETRTET